MTRRPPDPEADPDGLGIVPPYVLEAIEAHRAKMNATDPAGAHSFTRLRRAFICSCGLRVKL